MILNSIIIFVIKITTTILTTTKRMEKRLETFKQQYKPYLDSSHQVGLDTWSASIEKNIIYSVSTLKFKDNVSFGT